MKGCLQDGDHKEGSESKLDKEASEHIRGMMDSKVEGS